MTYSKLPKTIYEFQFGPLGLLEIKFLDFQYSAKLSTRGKFQNIVSDNMEASHDLEKRITYIGVRVLKLFNPSFALIEQPVDSFQIRLPKETD